MAREKFEDPKELEKRRAYRNPGEPIDERPITRPGPFWDSPEEMDSFQVAVRASKPLPEELPKGQYHSVSLIMSKIVEIAQRAQGRELEPAAKVIPFERDPGQEG